MTGTEFVWSELRPSYQVVCLSWLAERQWWTHVAKASEMFNTLQGIPGHHVSSCVSKHLARPTSIAPPKKSTFALLPSIPKHCPSCAAHRTLRMVQFVTCEVWMTHVAAAFDQEVVARCNSFARCLSHGTIPNA